MSGVEGALTGRDGEIGTKRSFASAYFPFIIEHSSDRAVSIVYRTPGWQMEWRTVLTLRLDSYCRYTNIPLKLQSSISA
jgi:hypothetical protein